LFYKVDGETKGLEIVCVFLKGEVVKFMGSCLEIGLFDAESFFIVNFLRA
jgi:hypothetical protein